MRYTRVATALLAGLALVHAQDDGSSPADGSSPTDGSSATDDSSDPTPVYTDGPNAAWSIPMDSAIAQQGPPTDAGSGPPSTQPYDSSSAATSITSKLNEEHAQTATDMPTTASSSTASTKTTSPSQSKATTPTKKATTPVKKTTTPVKKTTTKKKTTTPKKKTTPPKKKTTPKKKAVVKATKKTPTHHKRAVANKAATSSAPTAGCTNPSTILYGYVAPNDTGSNVGTGFILDSNLMSNSPANVLPPAGYTTSFTGQTAGLFSTNYVGYVQLPSYNTSMCAAYCNQNQACNAFNIYFERTPVYVPNQQCPNPGPPKAAVTCALWGDYVYNNTALNIGQYKNDFMVVITASNGYNQNDPPNSVSNYLPPNALYGGIQQSSTYGFLQYNTTQNYDPNYCANVCNAYTANARKNAVNGKYTPCNYFNTFNITTSTGAFYTMYCELFSSSDPSAGATITNATSGSTYFNVVYSYGYALYPPDTGKTSTTWTAAPQGSAASCSSIGQTGSTIVDYNGFNYTIACGYDVQYSNDVGNATAPDFYSCMNLCDKFTGCSGYAYFGTTCYFKNLTGATRTPQPSSQVNMAWLTSAYAGFNANSVAATITYTTFTTAWTGTITSTTTSQNGLTKYVIVETPGGTAPSVVTQYVDSGTASTIGSTSNVNGGTTTVTVVYPTPTYCTTVMPNGVNNYGARFGFYNNSAAGQQGPASYPGYNPTTIKTLKPSATGVATYIGEFNTAGNALNVYGVAVSANNAATMVISQTFYLYAGRGTGYYTFTIPQADDVEFLWVGQTALSGWNRNNSALLQYWSNTNTNTPQGVAFYLTFGQYFPIRVQFGNGGGQGQMSLTVTAPDGQTIAQSNQNTGVMNPDFVTSPCNVSLGAAFPAFGSET